MGVRQLDVSAVLELSPRRRRPASPALSLKLASEHITLRDIIGRAIEVEVRQGEARANEALGTLLVALLGGGAADAFTTWPRSDLVAETERALEGFKDGSYRVLFDGRPVRSLDEPLSLGLRSRVTFLRVVPLVSG